MKKLITTERTIFPGCAALGRELTDAASHLAPSRQALMLLLSTQHEANSTLQEAALTEQDLRMPTLHWVLLSVCLLLSLILLPSA